MGIRQYPSGKKDHLSMPYGLDTVNTLPNIRPGAMQRADNLEYRQGTLFRRRPFIDKSSVDFSQAADFGNGSETPGIFQGGHEYVDIDGTSRLLTAHNNGSVLEFVNASTMTRRTGFATSAKKVRFDTMLGACFACNGANNMQRGDGTAWRRGGAIDPATSILLSQIAGANVVNGTHRFALVAVLESGGVALVKSDWLTGSIVVSGGPGAVRITWTDPGDSRATHIYVYKNIVNLGEPYYYFTKVAIGVQTLDFDLADSSRSSSKADPQFRNGTAPVADLVTTAGERLVVGKISGAANAFHLSAVATDNYAMEYFPNDGKHRVQLPGKGPLTALRGIGVKDEDSNRNDLFVSQKTRSYILRGADPDNALEPVAGNVGCINPDAIVDWQGFLFFVSLRGLEFYGPQGKPLLISQNVQSLFESGTLQTPDYNGIQGESHIYLEIWENKLLVAFRDDSAKVGGNKTLVLDLEVFSPYEIAPWKTCRYTLWTGPGMFTFIAMQDRELVLLDNDNTRLLKRSTSTADVKDSIGGALAAIKAKMWSSGLLAQKLAGRKRFTTINVWQVCDDTTTLTIEADYDYRSFTTVLTPNATEREWDKDWDKAWDASERYKNCASIPRRIIGPFAQVKIDVENEAVDWVFVGLQINFTMAMQRLTCRR